MIYKYSYAIIMRCNFNACFFRKKGCMVNKENKSNIPKVIHYCWFGGNEPSEKMKYCIETWKKFLPDYEIKEWNDENIKDIKSSYLEAAVKNKMWAFVADYVRFWALYNYGGIYLDTDVEVFKSFNNLLDENDFFIGLESSKEGALSIGTATIGAIKNLPMLDDVLKMYDEHEPIRKNGHFDYFSTSPKMLVHFIKNKYNYDFNNFKYENEITEFTENSRVFPEIYFSANHSSDSNTYCKHHFNGEWGVEWQVKTLLNFKKVKLHVYKKVKNNPKNLPIIKNEVLLFYLRLNDRKSIALVSIGGEKENI